MPRQLNCHLGGRCGQVVSLPHPQPDTAALGSVVATLWMAVSLGP